MKAFSRILLAGLLVCAGPASAEDEAAAKMAEELGLDKERKPLTRGFRTRGAGGGGDAVLTRSGIVPRGAKRVSGAELAALREQRQPPAAPAVPSAVTTDLEKESVEVYADSRLSLQVLFRLDSAEFRAGKAEGVDKLRTLAGVLREAPGRKFLIEGHTCDLGPADHNDRLSWARAEMVRLFLIQQRVEAGRLRTLGCGEREAPQGLSADDRSPAAETVRQGYRRVVVREMK